MPFKTVIAGFAAAVMLVGSTFMPTAASAQRGDPPHPAVGIHPGGGFHPGGGIHPRGGFYGFRRGYPGWAGAYPWLGLGLYPRPYCYGPTCGYMHVSYYRHHRIYWHWVYSCD